MIVAQTLTDQDADDPSQVDPLLDRIDDPIIQVTADGAYDGAPTYQTIAAHGDKIEVVIPPRSTAVPNSEPDPPTQRDRHIAIIAEQGRLAWQVTTGYGSTVLSRNNNGSLQVVDWASVTSPRLRCPTDRGCHRRGCAKPNVGDRAPKFRPSPTGQRIATWDWGHLALHRVSAPTPGRGLPALLASQLSRHRGEHSVTMVAKQHAHWQDRLAPAGGPGRTKRRRSGLR